MRPKRSDVGLRKTGSVVEDAGRGWRRVISSAAAQRDHRDRCRAGPAQSGHLRDHWGGGGIPVIEDEHGNYLGTAAVIDKDYASSLLAQKIKADLFLISTAVEKVYINFNTPEQKGIDVMTASEARRYIADGQFARGVCCPRSKPFSGTSMPVAKSHHHRSTAHHRCAPGQSGDARRAGWIGIGEQDSPARLKAMDHVRGLQCTVCGREYGVGEVDYVCPLHGDDGILDVLYDYDRIRARTSPQEITASRVATMWRYRALLPVAADAPVPPLRVGWTPLYAAPRLARIHGLSDLWVKDDGMNPTASFKDRASALAVVKAQEAGATTITTASTGNAAAALAGLAASVGLQAVIFVPRNAPQAKIAQHLIYGARVFLVDGTYGDAFELTLQVARAYGWYNRNTAYNSLYDRGKENGGI